MSAWAGMTHLCTVYRSSALLADTAPAAATVAIARQPTRAACVEFTLSGNAAATGSATVVGTSDGQVGVSETVTFDGDHPSRSTVRAFTAITSITTAGLATESTVPTLQVRAVGPDGSAQSGPYPLRVQQPCGFKRGMARLVTGRAGDERIEEATVVVPYEEVWRPRQKDVLVMGDTDDQWIVVGRPLTNDTLRPTHWELRVQAREGSAP